MKRSTNCIVTLVSGALLGAQVSAQVTLRESVSSNEAQANATSSACMISDDGRYVAFPSTSSNLVPGDTNNAFDMFVRDRLLGTIERVSLTSTGQQSSGGDFWSPYFSFSGDGNVVTFEAHATDLVPGDTNGVGDIFVRDRRLGTTERVSVSSAGVQGNLQSETSSTSADGRYVAFKSYANNLVPGDTNDWSDIFVRDRQLGTTERVSIQTNGNQANSNSQSPAISADGRFVAFASYASNLATGDVNNVPDVFVRDRATGTTERITVAFSGGPVDGSCFPSSFSADGRFVAFESAATNLVPGDTNGAVDAFVLDRHLGTTERVSVSTSGAQASGDSPVISANGRYVAFLSGDPGLVPGDTNGWGDVFVRDLRFGTTERANVSTASLEANNASLSPSITADGRFVAFSSSADNLVAGDTNNALDIFVRDLAPSGFTALCDAGVGAVIACPCSNPPLGVGRGCDNSSGTGGAMLAASGAAYLSMDSLTFTTSDERPSALSILTQWTGESPSGVAFGMGVRCTSGSFKRLFSQVAVAGSITVPDLGAGDPPVSARSADLGSAILPGDTRWYFVYYRDPNVLGGCAATSTFNATQTGQVTWFP